LGLGLVVGTELGGVKIVFNRAEMTIYSVYCSRNLGCLCRAGRGRMPPSLRAHGDWLLCSSWTNRKGAFSASPQAIPFNITYSSGWWLYVRIPFSRRPKKHINL